MQLRIGLLFVVLFVKSSYVLAMQEGKTAIHSRSASASSEGMSPLARPKNMRFFTFDLDAVEEGEPIVMVPVKTPSESKVKFFNPENFALETCAALEYMSRSVAVKPLWSLDVSQFDMSTPALQNKLLEQLPEIMKKVMADSQEELIELVIGVPTHENIFKCSEKIVQQQWFLGMIFGSLKEATGGIDIWLEERLADFLAHSTGKFNFKLATGNHLDITSEDGVLICTELTWDGGKPVMVWQLEVLLDGHIRGVHGQSGKRFELIVRQLYSDRMFEVINVRDIRTKFKNLSVDDFAPVYESLLKYALEPWAHIRKFDIATSEALSWKEQLESQKKATVADGQGIVAVTPTELVLEEPAQGQLAAVTVAAS